MYKKQSQRNYSNYIYFNIALNEPISKYTYPFMYKLIHCSYIALHIYVINNET